jgi:hypothetical protein
MCNSLADVVQLTENCNSTAAFAVKLAVMKLSGAEECVRRSEFNDKAGLPTTSRPRS